MGRQDHPSVLHRRQVHGLLQEGTPIAIVIHQFNCSFSDLLPWVVPSSLALLISRRDSSVKASLLLSWMQWYAKSCVLA